MVTYTWSHRDTAFREIRASEKQLVHSDICHVILIQVRDEELLEGLLQLLLFQAASRSLAMVGLPPVLVGRGLTLSHLHGHHRASSQAGDPCTFFTNSTKEEKYKLMTFSLTFIFLSKLINSNM